MSAFVQGVRFCPDIAFLGDFVRTLFVPCSSALRWTDSIAEQNYKMGALGSLFDFF